MNKLLNLLLGLFILAAVISLPYVAYNVGVRTTAFNIAKQCALYNTFTEHGNVFYCSDIDDYRGK